MEHDSFFTAAGRHITTRPTNLEHFSTTAPRTWSLLIMIGQEIRTTTRTGRITDTRLAWLNANRGQHWGDSSPQVRAWRTAAAIQANRMKVATDLAYCTIDAYIYKPTKRRYDPNNLAPTAKAIVDGLVQDHGLLPDDDWRHLDGPHLHHGGVRGDWPQLIQIIIAERENPHA